MTWGGVWKELLLLDEVSAQTSLRNAGLEAFAGFPYKVIFFFLIVSSSGFSAVSFLKLFNFPTGSTEVFFPASDVYSNFFSFLF